MSKWRVNYIVSTNCYSYEQNHIIFEVKDKGRGYTYKEIRQMAKLVALGFENKYNAKSRYKCTIDMKSLRQVDYNREVTYKRGMVFND